MYMHIPALLKDLSAVSNENSDTFIHNKEFVASIVHLTKRISLRFSNNLSLQMEIRVSEFSHVFKLSCSHYAVDENISVKNSGPINSYINLFFFLNECVLTRLSR